ncbi:hypothetical protein FGO68_gene2497 [Halteria grandinella]|uniref:Uncharacterized protein n=1 Tax=Halteria grandinella TaxID=5974 RepID=A0A8J8SX22_HALGN|nr:hypothetical protein FGO68_gene2497 [Halteria grandinella]
MKKKISQQQWNNEEKSLFLDLLKKHGRDWAAIAQSLPRKTDKQCRNYFQNYKHKLKLIELLPPTAPVIGGGVTPKSSQQDIPLK